MTKEQIAAAEFCAIHQIDFSFLQTLQQSGLIEITTINEVLYIPVAELPQLEKIITFYYDLDINLEGIETINHLLHQLQEMKQEITILKNRLRLFEEIQ